MTDSIDFQGAGGGYEAYEMDHKLGNSVMTALMKHLPQQHTEFMDSIQDTLQSLKEDMGEAMQNLQDQIDNCGGGAKEQELKAKMDQMKAAWSEIVNTPPGGHRQIGDFKTKWRSRIANMRNSIAASYQDSANLKPITAKPVYEAKVAAPQSPGSQSASSAEAASSSAGASKSGTGLGAMEFDGKSVDQMINMMNDNPQALMDHLGNLSGEDRQMAMQMMMRQLQNMNQMFSMMSNMMKSLHDTAKAAINNMRV